MNSNVVDPNVSQLQILYQGVQVCVQKLHTKLSKPVDSLGRAKLIRKHFANLRDYLDKDPENAPLAQVLVKDGLLAFCLSKQESLLRYSVLTDSYFRCLLLLMRHRDAGIKNTFIAHLLRVNLLPFTLVALRTYPLVMNVIMQATETVTRALEYLSGREKARAAAGGPTRDSGSSEDSVGFYMQQLVIYGASTSFPRLLSLWAENSDMIYTRRMIYCLHFLQLHSTPELTLRISTSDNWAPVRALVHILRTMEIPDVCVPAGVLLLGLMSSNMVVADQVVQLSAVDDLYGTLTSAGAAAAKVPIAWLDGAQQNLLQLRVRRVPGHMAPAQPSRLEGVVQDMRERALTATDKSYIERKLQANRGAATNGTPGAPLAPDHQRQQQPGLVASAWLSSGSESKWGENGNGFWPEALKQDEVEPPVMRRLLHGPMAKSAGKTFDANALEKKMAADRSQAAAKERAREKLLADRVQKRNLAASRRHVKGYGKKLYGDGIGGKPDPATLVATAGGALPLRDNPPLQPLLPQPSQLANVAETLFGSLNDEIARQGARTPRSRPGSASLQQQQQKQQRVGSSGSPDGPEASFYAAAGLSGDAAGGHDDTNSPDRADEGPLSAVDKLNYAERLQVMILQCQGSL
jgi:hypothetical protein